MSIELWAGAECTLNRVGDRYFDQCVRTGHAGRLDDMDRLAALGAKRVRFPVLWERAAFEVQAHMDFSWHDPRLDRLRELGVEPILGLVHHGSGPRYAPIDSERFATGLAAFAREVAARYPWARMFTPVNEPLTTARFCGLYGHWYPHQRDTRSFYRLLITEIRATVLAMRAIRSITPEAQLIQTEDFGTTFGTPELARQCAYENDRRWLTFDLLTGRVTREHPLREHMESHGVGSDELDALCADPCPPDVIGVNYYVTSDRFLDDRLAHYPSHVIGGNGYVRYADVEAVRVRAAGIVGHAGVLREAFHRYGLPLAITETHLGCTCDEQLRWLAEAWHAARTVQAEGADIRAVTLWSVFGAVDWSSLLTIERGHFECGAYDLRDGAPCVTDLAALARTLARGEEPADPALDRLGWWRHECRMIYPPYAPLKDG